MVRIVVLVTSLLLSFPTTLRATTYARVLDVAWAREDTATKVVAHLDQPVRYRTRTDGKRVVVDLWPVSDAPYRYIDVKSGPVSAVRQEHVDGHIARLTIGLRQRARYRLFTRSDPHQVSVMIFPVWQAATTLPKSISYQRFYVGTAVGSTRVHVVKINPADPQIELRPMLGSGVVRGREPTAAAATKNDAIIAINGGFFTLHTGQPLGLVVIDGKVLSAPMPKRSVFAITAEGKPVIQSFTFQGSVVTDKGKRIPISVLNRPPRPEGLALYTPEFGPMTPDHALNAVVRNDSVVDILTGAVPIPEDGYVLAATAYQTQFIEDHLERYHEVRLDLNVNPGPILHALGGGPRLVKDGQVSVAYDWEWFGASFAYRRTSRSALGITPEGKIILVTVERSYRGSTGMNLFEVARLMRNLGAVQAMNLDGGGSSTLVVGGRVVNRAEEAQRGVASMLAVVRRSSPD